MTTTTTAPIAQVTEPDTMPLNKQDRCDACDAQAFMRATRARAGTLTFCGHHGNKFALDLIAQGFIVEDYRRFINEKNDSSA